LSIVEVIKYPTSYYIVGDPDAWTNPEYILGEHDGNCAIAETNQSTNRLYVTGFGFNIPSNAILDYIYFGAHMRGYYVTEQSILMYLAIGGYTFVEAADFCPQLFCGCADAVDTEYPDNVLELVSVTPDDLNSENFQYWFRGSGTYNMRSGVIDWCWLRVGYHLPTLAKKILGDGIVFIGGGK